MATQVGATLHGVVLDYSIIEVYPTLYEVKTIKRETGHIIWYGPFKDAYAADNAIGKTESYLKS